MAAKLATDVLQPMQKARLRSYHLGAPSCANGQALTRTEQELLERKLCDSMSLQLSLHTTTPTVGQQMRSLASATPNA